VRRASELVAAVAAQKLTAAERTLNLFGARDVARRRA
jgi:hypothetical protein